MASGTRENKRYINLLDGTSWLVGEDDCQGCILLRKENKLPEYLSPIYQDNCVVVRQDTEFAVPGFYIVSLRQHIGSIGEVEPDVAAHLAIITHIVRRAMKLALNITVASVYHEERLSNSHFHQWMLPYWEDAVIASGFMPKIYKSNIKKYQKYESNVSEYLRYFKFCNEKDRILKFNKVMKDFLKENSYTKNILKKYKFNNEQ